MRHEIQGMNMTCQNLIDKSTMDKGLPLLAINAHNVTYSGHYNFSHNQYTKIWNLYIVFEKLHLYLGRRSRL